MFYKLKKWKLVEGILCCLFLITSLLGVVSQAKAVSVGAVITVDNLDLDPNQEGDVSVKVAGIPASGLAGYQFTLSYDATIITILGIEDIAKIGMFASNYADPGKISIASASSEGSSGDLTLFKIRVKATGAPGLQTAISLKVEAGGFSDPSGTTQIPYTVNPGSVEIIDHQSAPLSLENIKITNNPVFLADTIEVSGLEEGATVKIYSDSTSADPITSGVPVSDQSGLPLRIVYPQIGPGTNTIYLTVARPGKTESNRLAVSFGPENFLRPSTSLNVNPGYETLVNLSNITTGPAIYLPEAITLGQLTQRIQPPEGGSYVVVNTTGQAVALDTLITYGSELLAIVRGSDGGTSLYRVSVLPIPLNYINATINRAGTTVILHFDSPLLNNKGTLEELKSAIKLSRDGAAFTKLSASDQIVLRDSQLIVTVNKSLTGSKNIVIVAADSLKNTQNGVLSTVIRTQNLSGPDECFIATASYGSKFEPAVVLLRQFRDDFLLTHEIGRAFVGFYYNNSPPLARFIAGSDLLKLITRLLLTPIVLLVYCLYSPWVLLLSAMIIAAIVYYRRINTVP